LIKASAKNTQNDNIYAVGSWIAFDLEWESESKPHSVGEKAIIEFSHSNSNENTPVTSEPPETEAYHRITTFAYEDVYGNKRAIAIDDFVSFQNPSQEFLLAIKNKLLIYDYCFAWGSKAIKYKNEKIGRLEGICGDLFVLDTNFRLSGLESIIRYDKFTGTPYIKSNKYGSSSTTDIDLLRVFAKPLVKYVIFKNRYKSLRLHDVSTSLLDYGKLASGKDIMNLSATERKAYCLQDAHIVADLVRINNGDILKIMQIIADHTRLKLDEVCHKGMTAIWKKILNDSISKKISSVGYDNIPLALHKLYTNQSYTYYGDKDKDSNSACNDEEDETEADEKELQNDEREDNFEPEYIRHHKRSGTNNSMQVFQKYKGAIVLEPIKGLHHDVYLFDVTSLYPTMIIKYNLSPETVNCSCCKNDPQGRLMITSEILKDCKYTSDEGQYWICQHRKGLFAKILEDLTETRIKYKNAGLEVESQAIKALINSGYGVFGHPYFKYYDPRVAELVTAFGRDTLTKIQAIADSLGFIILYGDTDSLFVNNVKNMDEVNKFVAECRSKLGVSVGAENTFNKLILVGKKHYVGILSDPKKVPIIKGMEGIKSDRPEFIHVIFRQLVDDIQNDINPIHKLRRLLRQLDNRQVPPEQLAIPLVLRKNPEEYVQVCKQSRLGTKLGLRKDDTLVYYKCNKQEPVHDPVTNEDILKTVQESENAADISYSEYKDMLVNSVEDVLDILGYDVEKDLLSKPQLVNSSYFKRR
jgi:hypothetical protein